MEKGEDGDGEEGGRRRGLRRGGGRRDGEGGGCGWRIRGKMGMEKKGAIPCHQGTIFFAGTHKIDTKHELRLHLCSQ